MERPTISIVIPVRGKLELLSRAIYSCLVQSYLPTEIILVDDSIDESEKNNVTKIARHFEDLIVASSCQIKIILSSSGGAGVSKARNLGIASATAEYIAFLDADDFYLPNKLEKQLEWMKNHKADFSHTDYLAVYEEKKSIVVDTSFNQGHEQSSIIAFIECVIATPTVMISANVVKNLSKLFPEDLKVAEDQVAWIRCDIISNNPMLHIPLVLSCVSVDVNSASQRPLLQKEGRKNLVDFAKSNSIKKPKHLWASNLRKIVAKLSPKNSRRRAFILFIKFLIFKQN